MSNSPEIILSAGDVFYEAGASPPAFRQRQRNPIYQSSRDRVHRKRKGVGDAPWWM